MLLSKLRNINWQNFFNGYLFGKYSTIKPDEESKQEEVDLTQFAEVKVDPPKRRTTDAKGKLIKVLLVLAVLGVIAHNLYY